MKPFILKQHAKSTQEIKTLEPSEINMVSGGAGTKENPVPLPPVIITGTRNGDGSDHPEPPAP